MEHHRSYGRGEMEQISHKKYTVVPFFYVKTCEVRGSAVHKTLTIFYTIFKFGEPQRGPLRFKN